MTVCNITRLTHHFLFRSKKNSKTSVLIFLALLITLSTLDAFQYLHPSRQRRPTTSVQWQRRSHNNQQPFFAANDNSEHSKDSDDMTTKATSNSLGQSNDDCSSSPPRRRQLIQQAIMASSAVGTVLFLPFSTSVGVPSTVAQAKSSLQPDFVVPNPPLNRDLYWPTGKVAFSLLPLAGTNTCGKTVEECIIPDTLWTYDQIQGVVNVNVQIRQTVIKLSPESGGGLWVHNSVAPTPELIQMMDRLIEQHGPI